MNSLKRSPYLPAQIDLYSESSVQLCDFGTEVRLVDGRVFRYCGNGGVALAAGKLVQAAAPAANHLNCAVAVAAAIGDDHVHVTLGATAAAANLYKEGWLHTNDAAGEGYLYKIKDHAAVGSAGTGIFYLEDLVRYALTTSSEVTLTQNLYNDVVVQASPNTSAIIGVPPIAVTADYFFWLQVQGPAVVLIDGTVVIGQHVRASDAVDGAVEPLDRDGTAEDEQAVGVTLRVNADTEYGLVYLQLL